MIQKINENAYFVVDTESFLKQINAYDPIVANQTICSPDITEEITVLGPDVGDRD
ncbi:MAG: hypothetical protein JRJ03_08745 [Deltaproteobacteria bacterium]|nr:hypothetical protein [Deltaproteobacteria bacterium]